MILDGSHKKWCFATLLLLLLATGAYVAYARSALGGPRGGSVPGMIYGIAGSALMVYAGLISARKKVPTWRIGSAQTWLRGHIWLGLLSVPLILFHAGFRWGGLLEQVLLLVMAAIVASGLIGLALQQFLPRQMTARVPLETFYAQLPYECRLLQVEGDVAVAAACGPLPVEPDEEVATVPRLKALGVTSRDRHQPLLAAVYRVPGAEGSGGPASEPARPTQKATAAVVATSPSAVQADTEAKPTKPLSAAEKIAAMRAAKQTPPKSLEPATVGDEAIVAADSEAPKTKLSAADKIALMRSVKRTTPKPEGPATPSEETSTATAEDAPKAKMTAAEKIALMRAGNKPPVAAVAEAQAPATPEGDGPKKALTAADKIAMMRAAKEAKPTVAAAAEPSVTPAAAEAETVAPAKLSAADKIALVRGKPKAVAPSVEKDSEAVVPASEPAPKKTARAVAPQATAEKKPPDAEARKRAAADLSKFYMESIRPFLAYDSQAGGPLASEVNAGGVFAVVGAGLPEELRPALDQLVSLCDKRRQLSVQERVHHWLHGWLFVHVPLSLALLGLGVVHVIVSLYY